MKEKQNMEIRRSSANFGQDAAREEPNVFKVKNKSKEYFRPESKAEELHKRRKEKYKEEAYQELELHSYK